MNKKYIGLNLCESRGRNGKGYCSIVFSVYLTRLFKESHYTHMRVEVMVDKISLFREIRFVPLSSHKENTFKIGYTNENRSKLSSTALKRAIPNIYPALDTLDYSFNGKVLVGRLPS